jgi:hypothetical protein
MSKHNVRTVKLPRKKIVNVPQPKEDHVAMATNPDTAKAEEGEKKEVNWRLRHDLLVGEVQRLQARVEFLEGANQGLAREKNVLLQQATQQQEVVQKQLTEINAKQQEHLQEITRLRGRLQEALPDGSID